MTTIESATIDQITLDNKVDIRGRDWEPEIRTGRHGKMYTLWHITRRGFKDYFIQNLGHDMETARKKFFELHPQFDFDGCLSAPDKLKKIVKGDDVVRFGRFKDCRVSEIDDVKYLSWLACGGEIKKEKQVRSYDEDPFDIVYLASDKIKKYAQDRLVQLGEWEEYNGKLMSVKSIERIKKLKDSHGHFFQDGQRIELKLKQISSRGYESAFGYVSIKTMMDESGKLFVYKGTSSFTTDSEVFIPYKVTIQHSAYNGNNQTMIKRVKAL